MPRMDKIFDEDPKDWPSMEELLRPKERLHTYYKTSDILRRLEEETDFSGERNLAAKKMKGMNEHFRRMQLYGAGGAGVKRIKKGTKRTKKGKAQFECNLPCDFDAAMDKFRDSVHVRMHGLSDLDRHNCEVLTPHDFMYLLHFDLHMKEISMHECAALAIALDCVRGEGHRSVIDFKKLLPLLKKKTSDFREDYHTVRKQEEDATERRKEERASKYAYTGEEIIYGPADEDFLASAVEKIQRHVQEYRRLHKVKFDEMCRKEMHGQLNPSKLRDFFRENLGLKLTRLESVAFVRYGDAFNAGTVPVSLVQEQMKHMSRGIGHDMAVPISLALNTEDDHDIDDDSYSLGNSSAAWSAANASASAQTAGGSTAGMSSLTSSGSTRILPVAYLHGLNGRRSVNHMRKFYLDAMLPKEHRNKKLDKTLISQLQGVIQGPDGDTKIEEIEDDDDEDDVNYHEIHHGDDANNFSHALGMGNERNFVNMSVQHMTETGGPDMKPLSLYRSSNGSGMDDVVADSSSSMGDGADSVLTSSLASKSLKTFKTHGTQGSVKYHDEAYVDHLKPTRSAIERRFVPEIKGEAATALENKVKRNRARDRGQGFAGRSVQSIHEAHENNLRTERLRGEAAVKEETEMDAFKPFDSPLAGSRDRILVPTTMGIRIRSSAMGGSTSIVRSKTPMALVRPINEFDATRERALANQLANEARPQDIFRGDLKRYLQAGLTRLPLEAKSSALKYKTRWELLCELAGNMKLNKVYPGRLLHELRKVGEMHPLEGIRDPNADTGVWIERVPFEKIVKKLQIMDVRTTNILFSALDARKRGAIALFELGCQLIPFCNADSLVHDGRRDRATGQFIAKITDMPRRVVSVALGEKAKGSDIIDSLLSVVEMEVFYWASVKYDEDRPIPGESAKETKMRLHAKRRKKAELEALGVEVVDVKKKIMEEKSRLTRGLCEAAICQLGTSHKSEVELLELSEALFGRMAMQESSKNLSFEVKQPEEITSTPVERDVVMENVTRSSRLCEAVEREFRTALYIGKSKVMNKGVDPRKEKTEQDEVDEKSDDASVGSASIKSLGGQSATTRNTSKSRRSVSKSEGPPPDDENHPAFDTHPPQRK